MIIRIVKLQFQPDKTAEFLTFFQSIKEVVNGFEGCLGMQLLQDAKHPNIIMTYSHWIDEDALENYRLSEAFGGIWPTIKPWFEAKPEAWTMHPYFDGFSLK